MSTNPPRYSAPDQSRQRLRLVAALGLLASAALVVGGLVHVIADAGARVEPQVEPAPASEPRVEPPATPARDSLDSLLVEVERAERAVGNARAALRRARTLGNVDTAQLDWLERRLDALHRDEVASPSTSPYPSDPARDL